MMVVMKLTAPRMVEKPVRPSPMTHSEAPTSGENVVVESGV
jgi:hypothetical protein